MKKVFEKELTNREYEVLCFIAKGYSNSVIANELCVTESTVKAHLTHIFEKLQVKNRIQAIIKIIKEGIV